MDTSIKRIGFVALLLSVSLPLSAHAAGWSFTDARGEWGKLALGLVSGIAAHEGGHYIVATSLGYNVGHDGFSIAYPGAAFTRSDRLRVASAGIQTQWLLAELVLRDGERRSNERPGNFGAGIVCAHLGITLAYMTVLKNHELGDIAGMAEATGRTHNQLALALAIPGILDAWRLFGHDVPQWVPRVSLMGKGIGIAGIWTY